MSDSIFDRIRKPIAPPGKRIESIKKPNRQKAKSEASKEIRKQMEE